MMRGVLLSALACVAAAHVCLLHPMMRGGANVSDPGDDSCFQPNACTRAQGAPTATLHAGAGAHVLLQQNLNHYNPGWPGYIDISWGPSAAAGGPWQVLSRVPDFWAHLQAAQTNFTVPVVIPAAPCAACVLRVRYIPHKPTEVEFWSCADVVSVTPAAPPAPAGALLALASPGAPASAQSQAVAVARIEATGEVRIIAPPPADAQLLSGVSAALGGALFTLARNASAEAADGGPAPAALLVRVPAGGGTASALAVTLPAGDSEPPLQWVALSAVPGWPTPALVLVGLAAGGAAGTFTYQARLLDAATGAASAVLSRSADEPTFVNVFQATVARATSSSEAELYLLAGDENSLFALNAAVFALRLSAGGGAPLAMTKAVLDNSRWTLGNLHLGRDGRLLSVSPGLYAIGNNSAADWSLVAVAPDTGAVSLVGAIQGGAAGLFAPTYGGAVYGDEPAGGQTLLHIFQHAIDGSFALATIDATSGSLITAPTLINGVNNELLFDTPVFVAAAGV